MRARGFVAVFVTLAMAAIAASAGAQAPYDPPRLPDGKPDLQGCGTIAR